MINRSIQQCKNNVQDVQYAVQNANNISCSFVAILVLIFVVIFVARPRFHRGRGGGGGGSDCARRWRHEKPSGGATVEKVNGSIHVSPDMDDARLRG